MGLINQLPLTHLTSKLINVTSLIQSIFASSNILFPWVLFGECHLPVGSWLKGEQDLS